MAGRSQASSLGDEADGDALGAGATGAADAMHVVLGVFRQVVVDDVANAFYVNAAPGDIRCHD